MGKKKDAEQEHARLLYVNERLTFEVIAERVGVSARTISRWCQADKWDDMRKSLLTTRQNVLTRMYNNLEALHDDIEKRSPPIPTTKEGDLISKLTTSIKRVETETGLGEYVETGRKVLTFIQGVDLAHAKLFSSYFDEFIASELKRR